MNETILVLLIFQMCLIFTIVLVGNLTPKCLADFHCQWKIMNCCPETAGANWGCVNTKTYNETECPKAVICPQYLSPRPSLSCTCENGECVVR